MFSQTVLVTGAPRSGTTPIGKAIASLEGAVDVYEPMGPTGDREVALKFPIPGEREFSKKDFASFLFRLQTLNMDFKPQTRPFHTFWRALATRMVGTRSLHSYRLAKLSRQRDVLVWKDPHAVFCAPFSAEFNFRSVVCVRPPPCPCGQL